MSAERAAPERDELTLLWRGLTNELKSYFIRCAMLRQEPVPESVSDIIEVYAEKGLRTPEATGAEPVDA